MDVAAAAVKQADVKEAGQTRRRFPPSPLRPEPSRGARERDRAASQGSCRGEKTKPRQARADDAGRRRRPRLHRRGTEVERAPGRSRRRDRQRGRDRSARRSARSRSPTASPSSSFRTRSPTTSSTPFAPRRSRGARCRSAATGTWARDRPDPPRSAGVRLRMFRPSHSHRDPSLLMNLRRYAAVLLPLAFTACLEGTDYTTNTTPNIPIEQTTFAVRRSTSTCRSSTKTSIGPVLPRPHGRHRRGRRIGQLRVSVVLPGLPRERDEVR